MHQIRQKYSQFHYIDISALTRGGHVDVEVAVARKRVQNKLLVFLHYSGWQSKFLARVEEIDSEKSKQICLSRGNFDQ